MDITKKCSKCRTEVDPTNPNTKMKFSQKCDHHLCKVCYNELYRNAQIPQLQCITPDCGIMLNNQDYKDESREEILFKKDLECRRRVLDVHNKQQSDFPSLDEYDDYLMMIEDTIQALVQGTEKEVNDIQRNLQKIQDENRIQIKYRKDKKQKMLDQMEEIERFIHS